MGQDKEYQEKVGSVLIAGAGISGMQSALDLAESGFKVYLVDKGSNIGGVMAALDKTFPTNDCAMCTLAPKLVDISRHPNIELITYAQVENISGQPGNLQVEIRKKPRYVDEEKCTGCGSCMENCPVKNQPYFEEQEKIVPQLSEEELSKVKAIISQHRTKKSYMMPILQQVNTDFNYLPAEVLKYIAEELDYPLSEIYRIVTFYNAFRLTPRGKYMINVCMGTSCYVRGSELILLELERILGVSPGGTTKDLKYSLESVRCIGCCSLAPVITIEGEAFGNLIPSDIGDILNQYA